MLLSLAFLFKYGRALLTTDLELGIVPDEGGFFIEFDKECVGRGFASLGCRGVFVRFGFWPADLEYSRP